ncbi:hypothetical protein NC652_012392 [Populus alba x Populus x berolinensis]|nr:hypothetical protein NC652_012392 [Populus alba x Populus x berolinensis]
MSLLEMSTTPLDMQGPRGNTKSLCMVAVLKGLLEVSTPKGADGRIAKSHQQHS